ncbi:ABC transporter ATP-binding protein/permease [Oceanicoccus sp. KOV_DT_Chl]|uniref:ABC transporter ATP-binding protein/permease n=1 Tax=Oceanicoccus sp. KOV_DT_Chl TaxID=1904639 RepID=UPI000C7AB6BA|nr:ABC transporter ATP-binding protein [Oceanicoccus sp. KOV_DT_Chl]
MIGVDDRLVTPETMKWVRIGLIAGLATIPTTIVLYYALGLAVDAALAGDNMLRSWIAAFVGLVLLKALLAWVFRTGQFRASSSAKLNVRDQIYKQVVKLGPGILGKRRTGEIANTATEGVEYLDYYFSVYFVQIWVAIAIPIFLCIAIFSIDWVVGLWMLAGVPLTPLFVGMAAQGFRRISGSNEETKNRNFAQYLDSIQGMTTLKMFNQDLRRGKEMEAGNELQRKQTMRLLLVAQFQFVFLELGFALFSTAFAMAVSLYRYTEGFMTAGEAVAVVLMSLEFSRTLLLIGEFFFAGALGREVAAKVVTFLNEEPPVKSNAGIRPDATNGRAITIEFRDIDFCYPGVEEKAIKNFNLTLIPNETVALIGKSGSGKTTITNLLLRTLDPSSGHIYYDGHKDEELSLEWVREQIALVPQDPFLFFGTLADNLRIAKQDATAAEIEAALRAAELWDFVQSSPAGIDTMVGDQGTALSGGQAQRLAIARALLKDAPIVVLDEPTSQIDVETETLLNRALERLTENKTVLLIAHRLSTIEQADRIVVMDNGELVESGSREALLAANGLYATMIKTKRTIDADAAAPAAI